MNTGLDVIISRVKEMRCGEIGCIRNKVGYLSDGVDLMFFFFQAEGGIRDYKVTEVQTCALPISMHYHRRQTDHFVFVKGMAKVVLYDNREASKTRGEINEFFMGEQNPILLVIPPFVLHGMKGVGTEPAYLVNTPSEHYVYDEPDEFRVPPHTPEVPYDWSRKDG